jgi:hypothetical protein
MCIVSTDISTASSQQPAVSRLAQRMTVGSKLNTRVPATEAGTKLPMLVASKMESGPVAVSKFNMMLMESFRTGWIVQDLG